MMDKRWFAILRHPKKHLLVAYCCSELSASQAHRISSHLGVCENCRRDAKQLAEDLKTAEQVVLADVPILRPSDLEFVRKQLTELLQTPLSDDPDAARRLTLELSPYLGAYAQTLLEQCGNDPKRLIEKADAVLSAFLGRQAAFAVKSKLGRR